MKKKLKLKKIWIIVPIILILLLAYPTYLTVRITSKDYGFGTVIKVVTNGIKDKVLENDYSKTLEEALNSKDYNKDNVDNYFDIEYHNKKDFISRINKLLGLGYTVTDINKINNKLTDEVVETLYEHELIKDISKYMEFDYFKSENLYRYLDYYYGNYQEAVVHVNIGLDKEYYEDVNVIESFREDVLANKYNKLSEGFEPNNLTKISEKYSKNASNQYLSKVAQVAFEELCTDALKEGKYILANSSYRSYNDQEQVYNTYLKLYGQTYVNNYVATPGYSEHQTGLALDVAAKDYNIFESSPEFTWMKNNAYKYGFILRYPKEKQEITGYKYEAWHYRYVGKDAAKYIQENNITYEEYYVMFLDK